MHMQIMVSLVNRNKACGDDASGEEACDDGKVRRPMLIGHQGPRSESASGTGEARATARTTAKAIMRSFIFFFLS